MTASLDSNNLPYCITIGDRDGIGPEIVVKTLQNPVLFVKRAWHIIGDIHHLQKTADDLNLTLPNTPNFLYVHINNAEKRAAGRVAYESVITATQFIANKKAQGLITGPISKENLKWAGVDYSGHTEILEDLSNEFFTLENETENISNSTSYQSDMLFAHKAFRILLLTRHVALKDVSTELNTEKVKTSLRALVNFLKHKANIETPKICILGVNPHAGEINGDEEKKIIQPALEAINTEFSLNIQAPKAADAVFRNFDADHPPYDAYVAPYHDQGLIPMKMVGGLHAVNITIGLPFVRTSVSHGTAEDIVGKGIADSESLTQAIVSCIQLTEPAQAT